MGELEITLPVGTRVGDSWSRSLRLRAWTSRDDLDTAEAASASPARQAATLLQSLAVAAAHTIGPSQIPQLTPGDRDYALLAFQRSLFGDQLPLLFRCPRPECEQQLELDLSIGSVLGAVPEPRARAARHFLELATSTGMKTFEARLPTLSDLAELEGLARADADAALRALAARCLGVEAESLEASVIDGLALELGVLDPASDIELDLECPSCARKFRERPDFADRILSALARRGRALFSEVHALARAYHWDEGTILALSPSRRRIYLDLVEDSGRAA